MTSTGTETEPPPPLIDQQNSAETRRRISAVWLVPLAALVVSLAVAWRSYSERGPLVEIVFEDAGGIVAGETPVRFRNLVIGVVEALDFSEDLSRIIVSARIEPDLARYLDEDTQFWVVSPQVTTQGVTGIETVLSGVYIETFIDDQIGERTTTFAALPRPPLTPADQPGMRVRLRAPDGGSLNVGAPVLFNRIAVGTVEAVELTPEGDVVVDLFVDDPHHLRLTTATRFWNISGFSLELGTGGASLNVDSLLTLVQGGVSFDTVTTGGEPVEPGHLYQLYPSEAAAQESVLEGDPSEQVELAVFFPSSVGGLSAGSPVEFRGIPVGEVTGIQTVIDPEAEGAPTVTTRTNVTLSPSRFGFAGEDARGDLLALLDEQVEDGLRARLASANLLTGALRVDLVELPEAEPAAFEPGADPLPVLPSAPSDVGDIAASAEGVLDRVANLPIEELLDGVVTLIANVNALVTDESIRAAPENLGLLLADLRALVGSEEIQAVPTELAALLASARTVVDAAGEAELVAGIAETLEEIRVTLRTVETATEPLPELMTNLTRLSETAAELPVESLVTETTELVASLDAFVAEAGGADLPAELAASLAELRAVLADLRAGGAVDSLNATLASAEEAAVAVRDAVSGLPDLAAQLSEIADRADATIATLGPDSTINRETLTLLREVRDAARSVNSLVQALERRPNSILFGR